MFDSPFCSNVYVYLELYLYSTVTDHNGDVHGTMYALSTIGGHCASGRFFLNFTSIIPVLLNFHFPFPFFLSQARARNGQFLARAWSFSDRAHADQPKIMRSNPARISWLHLWAEMFNLSEPTPMSSTKDKPAIKRVFIHFYVTGILNCRCCTFNFKDLFTKAFCSSVVLCYAALMTVTPCELNTWGRRA